MFGRLAGRDPKTVELPPGCSRAGTPPRRSPGAPDSYQRLLQISNPSISVQYYVIRDAPSEQTPFWPPDSHHYGNPESVTGEEYAVRESGWPGTVCSPNPRLKTGVCARVLSELITDDAETTTFLLFPVRHTLCYGVKTKFTERHIRSAAVGLAEVSPVNGAS